MLGSTAQGTTSHSVPVEKYLASADYISKAQGTQRHYRVALDQLREICGRALIADLQERHIRQIRKRFTATSKADLAVMLVRMLWVFAKEVLAMDLGPIRQRKFGNCIARAGRMNRGQIG